MAHEDEGPNGLIGELLKEQHPFPAKPSAFEESLGTLEEKTEGDAWSVEKHQALAVTAVCLVLFGSGVAVGCSCCHYFAKPDPAPIGNSNPLLESCSVTPNKLSTLLTPTEPPLESFSAGVETLPAGSSGAGPSPGALRSPPEFYDVEEDKATPLANT